MLKIVSTIILVALSGASFNAFSASNKQDVCHKGDDISVSQSAISAHVGHGDTLGECEDTVPGPGPEPVPETTAAVVMMRCEAVTGNGSVVVSASSSIILDVAVILPIPPVDDPDCAQALAGLMDAGFVLRSITSGSAQSGVGGDEGLHLYIDYLLFGSIPVDS